MAPLEPPEPLPEIAWDRHSPTHERRPKSEKAGNPTYHDRRADETAICHRAEQVRRPRLARPDGARPRGPARTGRHTDEDRQRHALAGLRPALRTRRIALACKRTRFGHRR